MVGAVDDSTINIVEVIIISIIIIIFKRPTVISYSMSNMDRLQVVDVCCTNGCWYTGAGFAPSELSTRLSVYCEN